MRSVMVCLPQQTWFQPPFAGFAGARDGDGRTLEPAIGLPARGRLVLRVAVATGTGPSGLFRCLRLERENPFRTPGKSSASSVTPADGKPAETKKALTSLL